MVTITMWEEEDEQEVENEEVDLERWLEGI